MRLWRKRRFQTTPRQRQHAFAYCREPRLFSQSLPRRESLLSVRARIKTPATISQDYLLGGCAFGVSGRFNGAEATATRVCALPRASLVLAISTAQRIFAISSSRNKNSCHSFARLSAWWVRLWRNRNIPQSNRCFYITAQSAISFSVSLRGVTRVATWQSSGAQCA